MSSAAANNSAGAASFEIPSTIYNQTISTTREDGRDQPPPPPPSSSSVLPTPIQTTPLTADSIISNLEKRMSELKRESQSKGAKGGAAEQGAFSSKSTSPTSPSRQHRAFTFPLAAGAGGGGGSSTVSSPHRQRHSDPRQIDADLNDLISNNILQEINAELAKDLEPKSSALSAHGETGRDDDLLVSSLTSSLYQTITTTTNTPSTNDAVAGSSASKTIPTPNIHHQQNNGDVDTSSISFSFNWDKTNDELSRLKLAAAAASSSSNGGGVNSTSLAAHHQHLDLATEDDFDDSVLEKRFESLLKGEIARAENILVRIYIDAKIIKRKSHS